VACAIKLFTAVIIDYYSNKEPSLRSGVDCERLNRKYQARACRYLALTRTLVYSIVVENVL
jgi:hypothetical protein